MRDKLERKVKHRRTRRFSHQSLSVWVFPQIWSLAGALTSVHFFFWSTKPFIGPDIGIPGWSATPFLAKPLIALAIFVNVVGLPMFVAGMFNLPKRWRGTKLWFLYWFSGFGLVCLSAYWASYPAFCKLDSAPLGHCSFGAPAVVSWGELGLAVAWVCLAILFRALKSTDI